MVIRKLYMDEALELDPKKVNPKYFLNIKNGVLNLKNLKLLPKDSDELDGYIFNYQVNANYLSKKEADGAKKQRFLKFLDQAMEGDKEKKSLFLSILGYILTDFKEARSIFFLVGATATGKSVIATLVTELLGEEYVTGLSLTDISRQFGLAELKNSRINISTEANPSPIKNTGTIKAITSGDRLFADQKNKRGINFRPFCKLVQIGNIVPKLKSDRDEGHAFKDRFVILKFNKTISKEERDLELENKMLLEELDFIFTIAITTFKKTVMDNNFIFPLPKESLAFIEEYFDSKSDYEKIDMFMNDSCIFGDNKNCKEHLGDLYKAYLNYVNEKHIQNGLTEKMFNKIVTKWGQDRGLIKDRFRKGEANKYGLKGIKLVQK